MFKGHLEVAEILLKEALNHFRPIGYTFRQQSSLWGHPHGGCESGSGALVWIGRAVSFLWTSTKIRAR